MPTLTVDGFKEGLDLRRLAAVSSAGLQEATNVFVNKGGQIERRPPLVYDTAIDRRLFGPFPGLGSLYLFHGEAAAPPNPDAARFRVESLRITGHALRAIVFCRPIVLSDRTDLYVVAVYDPAEVAHWAVYSPNTFENRRLTTNQVPFRRPLLAIAASRVFAADKGFVRYCKVGNPFDWRGTDDAGFLPAGRAAGGREEVTALGLYDDKLVVFFEDALQVWRVDEDPANMALVQHVEGVGTRYPLSVAQIGGHTVFLTEDGYRLLDTQRESQRIIVRDVGAPIDSMVRQRTITPHTGRVDRRGGPIGIYNAAFDQYLCFWEKSRCDVYSFSQRDRLAAWSVYELPHEVREVVAIGTMLYLRDDDDGKLYRMDSRPAPGQIWRDASAAGEQTEYPLTTAAQWGAVFEGAMPASWRAYADVDAAAAGSRGTRNPDTGPSKHTNAVGDFVSFEIAPGQAAYSFEMNAAILGNPEPGRALTLEYCAQGLMWQFYQYVHQGITTREYGIHVLIDVSDDAGRTWYRQRPLLRGWGYGDWHRGERLPLFAPGYFMVSASGGWRQLTVPLSDTADKARLRVLRAPLDPTWDHVRTQTMDLCLHRLWVAGGGTSYRSRVVLPFLDARRPGVGKQWQGARVVQDGECDLSFQYKVPAPDGGVEIRETRARRARGGERAQPLHAIGLAGRDLAPVLSSDGGMGWTVGAVDLEYQYLNAWS